LKVPPEIVDKIRESADIIEIIGEIVQLKKRGQNYIGLCPFHKEKTPSFTVSPDKGIYKCFGCGKAGNVITFISEYHGLNFFESLSTLANKYGTIIPKQTEESNFTTSRIDAAYDALKEAGEFYATLLRRKEGAAALQYFYKRDFSDEIIDKFLLGYSPSEWDLLTKKLLKHGFEEELLIDAGLSLRSERGTLYDRFRSRAMFAIRDFMGRVIGFGARLMIDDKTQAKYINSPQSLVYDKSKVLYGIYEAKTALRDKKFAIMVEGYADYITLFRSGFENVVASSGTSLTLEQLNLLKRYTKSICFCYDGDEAGLNAANKGAESALTNGFDVSVVRFPDGEDPDSIIKTNGFVQMEYLLRDAESFLDFKYKLAKQKGDLNTAQSLSEFVRTTVKTIVSIPDSMQHDFYIRKLSGLLDLSESQLRQVYKFRGQFIEQMIQEDRRNLNNLKDTEDFFITDATQTNFNFEELVLNPEQIINEEKLILNYALQGLDEFTDLIERFDVGSDTFFSDSAKALFTVIQAHSDKDDILNSILSDGSLSKRIKSILADIALAGESPSENWHKRFQVEAPKNDYITIISDAITGLKLREVQKNIKEVQDLMRNDENNINHKRRFIELLRKEKELYSLKFKL
jgi:DNA primase